MPIKVFSAPGDHRTDFRAVEDQFNQWQSERQPKIVALHCAVNNTIERKDLGTYILTIVAHYE
jgi:hypothetical protein